jgi:hypothetical protein
MKLNKKFLFLCYTLTLCAIVWYPANTVRRIEFPAEKPVEMKFRVRLYDPYDPMRGRYVRLQAFPDRIETADKTNRFPWRSKEKIFAVLQRGKDGFAQVLRLEKNIKNLKQGEFAVRVSSCWYQRGYGREKGKNFYTFSLPFKQYFVNEFKAPLLEEELRKRSSKNKNMILTVRFFKDGVHAVSSLSYP